MFKLLSAIYYASFWYGADAIFYIVLSAIRLIMLRHVKVGRCNIDNEYRQYRFCGCLLFVLNIALSGVVFQIVYQNMGYSYPGLLIYLVATYTFFCLIVAIINVVKYRKLNSPALSAIKAISLTKALVAVFALQTAMFASFGSEESEVFQRITNTAFGAVICLSIFAMATIIVVEANKNLGKIAINNSQTIV